MPPQLPCSGHRDCTFHKHWDRPHLDELVRLDNDRKWEQEFYAALEGRSVNPQAAPIQDLPTELLLLIASFASPRDKASLALTCRSFAYFFGTQTWTRYSRAGGGCWGDHIGMLDVLQRELDSKEYWRCHDCLIFHPRAKAASEDDQEGWCGHISEGLKPIHRSKIEDSLSLRTGVLGDPNFAEDVLYRLDHSLLKAVMDRHTLGASHGMCLQSLKCSGTRTWPLTTTAHMVLKYRFEPQIAGDRLRLRSTYNFRPKLIFINSGVQGEGEAAAVFLEHIDFWICGHMHTRRMFEAIAGQNVLGHRNRYIGLQCSSCPTQYEVTVSPEEGVRIRVWQIFLVGGNPRETRVDVQCSKAGEGQRLPRAKRWWELGGLFGIRL